MEGDVTAAPLSEDNEHGVGQCFGDVLDKLCAYYMAMGVSADEYWNGDYTMLKFYAEKHRLAVEQQNEQLWLQGVYFYEAIAVALANAFSKHSNAKYPDKPYRLTPMSEEEQELENKRKVEEFRANLVALGRHFEAKHKREQGGENLGGREPNI